MLYSKFYPIKSSFIHCFGSFGSLANDDDGIGFSPMDLHLDQLQMTRVAAFLTCVPIVNLIALHMKIFCILSLLSTFLSQADYCLQDMTIMHAVSLIA